MAWRCGGSGAAVVGTVTAGRSIMSSRSCDTVSLKTSDGLGALYPGTTGGLFGVTAAAVDFGSVAGGEDGFVHRRLLLLWCSGRGCRRCGRACRTCRCCPCSCVRLGNRRVHRRRRGWLRSGGHCLDRRLTRLGRRDCRPCRLRGRARVGALACCLGLAQRSEGGCSGAKPCATIVCFAIARAWSRSWILVA